MSSATFPTPLGPCNIAWEGNRLTGLRLKETTPADCDAAPPPDWVTQVIVRLRRHLHGEFQDFSDLPFDFGRATPFQQSVYRAALKVKPGCVRTYGWLATAIGKPSASRAVGAALGRNPWLLLVPCHRFVGAGGALTGFSAPGGIATKQRLLTLEGGAS